MGLCGISEPTCGVKLPAITELGFEQTVNSSERVYFKVSSYRSIFLSHKGLFDDDFDRWVNGRIHGFLCSILYLRPLWP